MRRALAVGFALASACLSGPGASARQAPSPLEVEVSRGEGRARVVTLSFTQGYALNAKVPAERRLRLEVGDRVWTTGAFTLAPGRARVEVEAPGARQGDLTVYLCRPDRCTRVRRTLTF
jgi:hypothetical protein